MESVFAFLLALFVQFWGLFIWTVDIPTDATFATTTQATLVRVIDGDTIVVEVGGREETVRYIGIDTPEPYRDAEPACFSAEASNRNKELLSDGNLTLVADREDRDRYDRLLRYVYVDEMFVNEVLLQEGYAKTLKIQPNVQFADEFTLVQDSARERGLGLWGECY